MVEYINRELARFEAKRYFKNLDEIQEDLDMIFCMLPAEGVAPVVRCKDCRHWNKLDGEDENKRYFCNVDGMWCKPARRKNDFCSYGERKEGAE